MKSAMCQMGKHGYCNMFTCKCLCHSPESLTRLAGTAVVNNKIKQAVALFLHDMICHPLIFVTSLCVPGGASWAWALHDDVGEIATTGKYRGSLQVNGPGPMVQQLMDDLEANGGWNIQGSHLHGDARGCFSAAPKDFLLEKELERRRAANNVRCTNADCGHIRGMHDLAKRICLTKDCPCQGFYPASASAGKGE
jgi:hypothetical protein